VERPTGRTTLAPDAWSARLVLGRWCRDDQASTPATHNRDHVAASILEPEVPAGGMQLGVPDTCGTSAAVVVYERSPWGWLVSQVCLLSVVQRRFQRLSDRLEGKPPTEVLHEGVPAHLERPLRSWIYQALKGGGGDLVAVSLEIPVEHEKAEGDPAKYLAGIRPTEELLDIADAILQQGGPWPWVSEFDYTGNAQSREKALQIKDLELILSTGSSFLRLNDTQDGLTRRIDVTATDAFTTAAEAAAASSNAGSAASQIREAWKKLYQRNPDSSAAYGYAIKAVESAAHAIIEPNNSRATLGTMLGALRGAAHRYQLVLPGPSADGGVDALIKMLELLWTGQTSRHGAQTDTRNETQEEAQMAVHLAMTLVHWFTTGAVTRRP
jgi:hypothetical protein